MKKVQILYVVVLVLAAVLVLQIGNLITGYESTASVSTQANVGNVAPTVSNVVLDDATPTPADQIDLSAGTTKTVTCTGVIDDQNGYDDIVSANATIWSSSSSETAADDNNNHYTNTSCVLSAGYDTTKKNVTCTFSMQYYADNGTWTCKIYGIDNSSAYGSATDTATVNSLIALDTDATLDFGTLSTGETSSSDVNHTVRNYGNRPIDIQLNGTDMSCSVLGTIPVDKVKYSLTYDTAYTNMTSLTTTMTLLSNFDLAVKTTDDATPISKDTYWKIQIPSGVKGTCTGTIQFTAVESS